MQKYMSHHYKFFNHKQCEYYPCHQIDEEKLNCLFCFCPLYVLKDCGGHYKMTGNMKDCSDCLFPHHIENYDYIIEKYKDLKDVICRIDNLKNNE